MTWHDVSGLLVVASLVCLLSSAVLFAFEVFAGGYFRWTLTMAEIGVALAFLARWAELRYATSLLAEMGANLDALRDAL